MEFDQAPSDKPVHFSLTFHNQSPMVSSLAASATSVSVKSLQKPDNCQLNSTKENNGAYLKYRPVLLANSGSNATYNVVCAPDTGVFKNGHTNGRKINLKRHSHVRCGSTETIIIQFTQTRSWTLPYGAWARYPLYLGARHLQRRQFCPVVSPVPS